MHACQHTYIYADGCQHTYIPICINTYTMHAHIHASIHIHTYVWMPT